MKSKKPTRQRPRHRPRPRPTAGRKIIDLKLGQANARLQKAEAKRHSAKNLLGLLEGQAKEAKKRMRAAEEECRKLRELVKEIQYG